MSSRGKQFLPVVAMVFFVIGVVLSQWLEPGVRVKAVLLADDTPALQFVPSGPGPNPVALLAHGVTASKETLFRFGEALAAAGFICYAVDMPGHGESRHAFSQAGNPAVLTALARAVGPVDVFLGHSMGAGVGGAAVQDGGFTPRLFIAVGALPNLGEHGPPLLLLAGQFEELIPPTLVRSRVDARSVISSWSDHALEPYDPLLVNAAVEAACDAVGRKAPSPPTRWLWRLGGLLLSVAGAFGFAWCLPELPPRLERMRGPFLAVMVVLAFALAGGSWSGTTLHLRRADLLLGTLAIALLVGTAANKLRVPRWAFPALAAAAGAVCAAVALLPSSSWTWGAFHLLALVALLFSLILAAGAVLGGLAARRGPRLGGDLAMAIFVGYALGQWVPRFF